MKIWPTYATKEEKATIYLSLYYTVNDYKLEN